MDALHFFFFWGGGGYAFSGFQFRVQGACGHVGMWLVGFEFPKIGDLNVVP